MKKVLVITYYWPPGGGAGVQRWLKFVKYLREYGWEPVVYTPENPEVPALDYSLEKDIPEGLTVVKTKIWEPYTIYKKFTGQKKEETIKAGFLTEKKKPSVTENLSVWIRGNFFIPDARKFWIKPSVRFLTKYLKENPVDAIVSTGPPHSMHLIALGVKRQLKIPWLADFRDPWTNIDFYDKLKLTAFADRKHRKLEREVLMNADMLTTVSWSWAKDFEKLGAKNMQVVTNGFDPADFSFEPVPQNDPQSENGDFEICHIGSMNKDRNPVKLWEAIADYCEKNAAFRSKLKLSFIGQTDISVKEALKQNGLLRYAVFESYKPHSEVLMYAYKASVLLLALNNTPNVEGVVPGKLYEYLAMNRPVLCIGSTTGDSARIIEEVNAGVTVDFYDIEGMLVVLNDFFENNYGFPDTKAENKIMKYSRKELTGKISNMLNLMITK